VILGGNSKHPQQPINISDKPQTPITICIPLSAKSEWGPVREADVTEMIGRLGNPARAELRSALDKIALIHFISMHLIPSEEIDRTAHIVIEASVDGNQKDAIYAIANAIGDELFPILRRACGCNNRGRLGEYLYRHSLRITQSYVHNRRFVKGMGFQGIEQMPVTAILKQNDLITQIRRGIDTIGVDIPGPLGKLNAIRSSFCPDICAQDSPTPIFADAKEAPWIVSDRSKYKSPVMRYMGVASTMLKLTVIITFLICFIAVGYALNVRPVVWSIGCATSLFDPSVTCQYGGYADGLAAVIPVLSDIMVFIISTALAAVATVTILAAVMLFLYAKLRKSEAQNIPRDIDPDPKVISQIMIRENAVSYKQNHMVSVTRMIPGRFRIFTLLLAFRLIAGSLAKGAARRGFLADVGTIHFARWIIIPGTSRLVFLSNYSGSWESYLEDFITKAASGTTGVWSNTIGFPHTENLFFKGAADGDRFKRFARASMIPTQFWYSAYPALSAEQIRKNMLIYDGLCKINGNSSEAEAWIQLFDSIPRPESALEHEEIQNLLYGGLGQLNQSSCIPLQFGGDNPEQAQAWLREIVPHITAGDKKPNGHAIFIAFSSSGLRKLGYEEELNPKHSITACEGDQPAGHFPPAFALGMDHETRQRMLHDPDPENWQWGSGKNAADAVLLLYGNNDVAKGDLSFKSLSDRERSRAKKAGLKIVDEIHMAWPSADEDVDSDNHREPFGFRDGVSQPILRGMSPRIGAAPSIHTVEPGEFILGYLDNRGYYPPTPQISAAKDIRDQLHDLPANMPKRFPKFETEADRSKQLRDFGRNGSFLVIRQLSQDTEKFREYTQTTAEEEGKTAEFIAAKMVGRWPNGSSLVKNPYESGTSNGSGSENEFLFADTDPQGIRCPFGSHIRRANPRDSLNIESPSELSVSNRHRLLRRGRPYVKDGEQGVMFICFNADIERQFEFVQSTWLCASAFHGLNEELDPLTAQHDGNALSVPSPDSASRYRDIPSFTTMRGGGYFFMPGMRSLHFLAGDEWQKSSPFAKSKVQKVYESAV
jgi:deferrochelatase/peroxidase EfeB